VSTATGNEVFWQCSNFTDFTHPTKQTNKGKVKTLQHCNCKTNNVQARLKTYNIATAKPYNSVTECEHQLNPGRDSQALEKCKEASLEACNAI
jgi:hypothetical protein